MKHVRKSDVFLPNLTQYLNCCTSIYLKINALLPQNYRDSDSFCWSVEPIANLTISIEERYRYTDAIQLKIFWIASTQWLTNFVIQLRMYHDLQIAEVIGYKTKNKVIDFQLGDPKSKKNYIVEKKQIHHVLSEFLSLNFQ
ncbi:MAG TPA: DUF1249 domain-containing protein [Gammaproteobacteria bacterium]|nr:DUF1249 domain-containing protein [Gammaproteobacteria bacterium]